MILGGQNGISMEVSMEVWKLVERPSGRFLLGAHFWRYITLLFCHSGFFGFGSDVGIVPDHFRAEMTGNRHHDVVWCVRFRQLCYASMSKIVET
jgi:hypothetical protein